MKTIKAVNIGLLGATGLVGQELIRLVQKHPWFSITALAASDRSVGKIDASTGLRYVRCTPEAMDCDLIFSTLDASVAGEIETRFKEAGHLVISNAKNHRMDPSVPLIVPEVNGEKLELEETGGAIVTNPNCSVIGLALALAPLEKLFGIKKVHAVTMQALSGAGKNPALQRKIEDNVIPFIEGEEEKIESELLKIFPGDLQVSAQANRVPVSNGHLASVSVQLETQVCEEEIIEAWNAFPGLDLPSAPLQPIVYHKQVDAPQPKLHRDLEGGMAVSIGRLRRCPILGWKFVILSHNLVRGAAGGALLIGELLARARLFRESSRV